ncbi:hypothetical protein [Larsenimonas suaedae]|uniref:Uncharacterized protein n=1 Tax=Larsenimonas suaedae TaxID=1851019 RepID=A0ABU1GT79_9GAMM|nr:hypothetical protein [Larsenimonas suaedae]MCM2971678.1 hypothetical protein [Larsenimonas suaedae]MDR5895230.1 hypothetical protein [Larsenimonas suaedae]
MSDSCAYSEPERDSLDGKTLLMQLLRVKGVATTWLDESLELTGVGTDMPTHRLPAVLALQAARTTHALRPDVPVALMLSPASFEALFPSNARLNNSGQLLVVVVTPEEGGALNATAGQVYRRIEPTPYWLCQISDGADLVLAGQGAGVFDLPESVLTTEWDRERLHLPSFEASGPTPLALEIRSAPQECNVALIGELTLSDYHRVADWAERERVLCLSLPNAGLQPGAVCFPGIDSESGREWLTYMTQLWVIGSADSELPELARHCAPIHVNGTDELASHSPQGDESFYLRGCAQQAALSVLTREQERAAIKQLTALDVLTERRDVFVLPVDWLALDGVVDEQTVTRCFGANGGEDAELRARVLALSRDRNVRVWVVFPEATALDWSAWQAFWNTHGQGRALTLLKWQAPMAGSAPVMEGGADEATLHVDRATPGALQAIKRLLAAPGPSRLVLNHYRQA